MAKPGHAIRRVARVATSAPRTCLASLKLLLRAPQKDVTTDHVMCSHYGPVRPPGCLSDMRSGIRTIDRTLSTTRLSGSAVGIGGMANWIIPHFAPAVSEGLTPGNRTHPDARIGCEAVKCLQAQTHRASNLTSVETTAPQDCLQDSTCKQYPTNGKVRKSGKEQKPFRKPYFRKKAQAAGPATWPRLSGPLRWQPRRPHVGPRHGRPREFFRFYEFRKGLS